LYAEILASITFALVAYQDFRERMVSDYVWIPAIVAGVVMLWERPEVWVFSLAKVGIFGALGALSIIFGLFGQADGLTIIAMAVGTSVFSPIPQMFAAAVVAMSHILYLAVRHGSLKIEKTMPVEEAVKQNTWIPLEVTCDGQMVELDNSPEKAWNALEGYLGKGATVKASYGVPFAGYLAVGYLVAFVVLLVLGPV
jgi:hypothetical protein